MANGPLGYSFAPTFENADLGKRGGSPAEFPQGSVKVLNFQIPRIAGAPGPNAISPLVGDTPSGASFGSSVLQSVLHTVLGPDAGAAAASASPGAAASGSAVASQSQRDPGAALLEEWLRRQRELNGRGGSAVERDDPAPGPSSMPSPSAPSAPPSAPNFDSPSSVDSPAPAPPPLRGPGPPTITPGGDSGDPGSPPASSGDPVGPSFNETPDTPEIPAWRQDKYFGGWGQDYQQ